MGRKSLGSGLCLDRACKISVQICSWFCFEGVILVCICLNRTGSIGYTTRESYSNVHISIILQEMLCHASDTCLRLGSQKALHTGPLWTTYLSSIILTLDKDIPC